MGKYTHDIEATAHDRDRFLLVQFRISNRNWNAGQPGSHFIRVGGQPSSIRVEFDIGPHHALP
jgi:hypothetical protein